ncbi:MAG TPA: SgcJ/EcaC family oxidoreductase [Candidatus Saccharimonadales bacterium]|jgi:uncharacterized protein (TIGR02246 family)|nr:SgcJ/EcaC family oxidoreductase [Candidatus Saccharimonadales bacterium]
MEENERAIRELIESWMKASSEGDLPKILSLMSDDVVFLRAGHPPMRGKQAFADSLKNMEGMKIEGQSEIQEIHVAGELAYAWTNLTVRVTPPSGAAMKRSGHTLTVSQKQSGGRWVLLRDANMLTANPEFAS